MHVCDDFSAWCSTGTDSAILLLVLVHGDNSDTAVVYYFPKQSSFDVSIYGIVSWVLLLSLQVPRDTFDLALQEGICMGAESI